MMAQENGIIEDGLWPLFFFFFLSVFYGLLFKSLIPPNLLICQASRRLFDVVLRNGKSKKRKDMFRRLARDRSFVLEYIAYQQYQVTYKGRGRLDRTRDENCPKWLGWRLMSSIPHSDDSQLPWPRYKAGSGSGVTRCATGVGLVVVV